MTRTPDYDENGYKERCPACAEVQLFRLARSGFLQERIYPWFGKYPWECAQCRRLFLLRMRGKSYRKASPQSASK
jgi:hypothetical protein